MKGVRSTDVPPRIPLGRGLPRAVETAVTNPDLWLRVSQLSEEAANLLHALDCLDSNDDVYLLYDQMLSHLLDILEAYRELGDFA